MLANPQELILDFVEAMRAYAGRAIDAGRISFDSWPSPHQAQDLPPGKSAVYVFSLAGGTKAPAGPHRVIKVGKVGPNSNLRFRYQHYKSRSALSTLAGAIENNPVLWGHIGFPGRDVDAGAWLRENSDRNNFYFDDVGLEGAFEVYARGRLDSVY